MKSWINLKLTTLCIIAFTILLNSCSSDETEVFGGLHGNVTDVNGDGMQNVSVTLNPEGKKTTTGSDGRYEYSNLKAGQYTLQFVKDGFNTDVAQTTIISGQTAKTDMILKEGDGTLRLNLAELIFGKGETDNLPFEIHNTGKVSINWQITTPNVAWIKSVTPLSGTTATDRKSSIVVAIDRAKLVAGTSTYSLVITSNSGSATLLVKASNDVEIVDPEKPGEPNPSGILVKNGLYAFYKFENDTKDVSETRINGVAINNPSFEKGSIDGSTYFKLNKTEKSYLSVPEGLIGLNNSFSVSFWVKGLQDGHIFHADTSSNHSSGEKNSFNFYMKDGRLTFVVRNYHFWYQYTNNPSFSHGNITDESWHMITLTSDFGVSKYATVTTKLYIDGEYTDVIATSCNPYDQDDYTKTIKFVMGSDITSRTGVTTLSALSMSLDNLRIYNTRVLSASEVKTIFNGEGGAK